MTIEDFLKEDDTYIPKTKIQKFIHDSKCKELRRAYEKGIKTGIEFSLNNIENNLSLILPYDSEIPIEEYNDFRSLLIVMGYKLYYVDYGTDLFSGLIVCKDKQAINKKLTVSKEVKQRVYDLLKENSDPLLWKK